MLTDVELEELLEDLESQDLVMRVASLQVLQSSPVDDPRILSYLESRLGDRTPCVLSIPYEYGEIRWLVAHALISVRKKMRINTPVVIERIPRPLDTTELSRAAKKANVRTRGGREGILEKFRILSDIEALPLCNIRLTICGNEYECQPSPLEPN